MLQILYRPDGFGSFIFFQLAFSQIVADSTADFPTVGSTAPGLQGLNGWTHGYHNLTANGAYDGANFIPFPTSTQVTMARTRSLLRPAASGIL